MKVVSRKLDGGVAARTPQPVRPQAPVNVRLTPAPAPVRPTTPQPARPAVVRLPVVAAPPPAKPQPVRPTPQPVRSAAQNAQQQTPPDVKIPKRIVEALPEMVKQIKKHDAYIKNLEARDRRRKLTDTLNGTLEKFLKTKNVDTAKVGRIKAEAEASLRQKGYKFDVDGKSLAVVNADGKKLNLSIERIFDEALKAKFPEIYPAPQPKRVATETPPPAPAATTKPGSFASEIKKSVAKDLGLAGV